MKTCKICQREKPLCEFPTHSSGKNGLRAYCRVCKRAVDQEYKKHHVAKSPLAYKAKYIWDGMQKRVGKGSYAGVQVRMTKEEFLSWAVPEYLKFYSQYPNENPAVDRIDPDGHYEIGNIRLITCSENSKRVQAANRIGKYIFYLLGQDVPASLIIEKLKEMNPVNISLSLDE